MKCRKKPIVLEAIQWNGNNEKEIAQFIKAKFSIVYNEPGRSITTDEDGWITTEAIITKEKQIAIDTIGGTTIANKGDYIVRDENGGYTCYDHDTFVGTYEVLEK
jgi:hypothetical protein